MKHLLLVAALLPLAACSDPEPEGPVPDPALEAYLKDPLAYTRGQIDEIMTRPEHEDPIVEVQHILIGVASDNLPDSVTREAPEAEALMVEIYGKVLRGEDFDTLVQEHSDDTGSLGIYLMTLKPGGAYWRGKMAKSFGDIAWHLQVGEVGIAPYDVKDCKFGWHIIKRIGPRPDPVELEAQEK